MTDPGDLLFEWHSKLGHKFGQRAEHIGLRLDLIREEVEELIDAVHWGDPIENIAKELADIVYVVYGTAYGLGIPLTKILELVHQNNMTKIKDGVYQRPDGKILKPHDYVPVDPADIRKILEG